MKESYSVIPDALLTAANNDPVLKGFIGNKRDRVAIYDGEAIVGFMQPSQIEYKDKTYWRTGNIFVLPEHRNKGLGSKAILDFFSDKTEGLAWIAFDNVSSMRAFAKAGFHKLETETMKNPKGKILYLWIKETTIQPLFVKW